MIKSILVKGYKKIQTCNLCELRSVNYLVGPNGCGKSSLLESMVMIGANGEPNTSLSNRIGFHLGNMKDIFDSNGGMIKVTGEDSMGNPLTNNYLLDPYGNIIRRQNDSQFNLISRGFILSNLRDITYFNGNMFSSFSHSLFDVIRFNPDNIDSSNRDAIITFLNQYFFTAVRNEKKIVRIFRSIDTDNSIQLEKEGGEIINLKALSSGQLSLLGLYFSIYSAIKELISSFKGNYIILVDEPENSLHPDLHKELNQILLDITRKIKDESAIDVQFIISTHSPFVISSINNQLSSKIYLIQDGATVDMKGRPGKEEGYSSQLCLGVASKMLGAGLGDLTPVRNIPEVPSSTIRIIYCEGSGEYNDSIYYNIIFPEYGGIKNHFISLGGGNSVVSQTYIGRDVSQVLGGGNIICQGLVDRSNSSDLGFMVGDRTIRTDGTNIFSDIDRDEFHVEHTFIKMLNRREIENYLYDTEVLHIKGIEITPEIVALRFKDGEVKDHINGDNGLPGIPALRGLDKKELAQIIHNHTELNIYKELESSIFSPFVVNISGTTSSGG